MDKTAPVDPKPEGFAWCPDEIWRAYRRGKEYKGIPPDVLLSFLNMPYRETVARMLIQCNSREVISGLLAAERRPGVSVDEALKHAFLVATMPADAFIPRIEWSEARPGLNRLNTSIGKLHDALDTVPLLELQALADDRTNFARTGHISDVSRLIERIMRDTALLKELCGRSPPPPGDVVPRKLKAARAKRTIKARLLKREFAKYFIRPGHRIIADLINLAELPDPPVTDDDVRKA